MARKTKKSKKNDLNIRHIQFIGGTECIGEVVYDMESEKKFLVFPIKAFSFFDGEKLVKNFSPWNAFSDEVFFELLPNTYISNSPVSEDILKIYNEIIDVVYFSEKMETPKVEISKSNVINFSDYFS